MSSIEVEGKQITVSNPNKLLWPDMRKADYLKALTEIAPYLLPHTQGKALTAPALSRRCGRGVFLSEKAAQRHARMGTDTDRG